MPDRVFFIGAIFLAGLMIALGVLPGMFTLPSGPVSGGNTDYRRIEISGDQLNRLVAGGDSTIDLIEVDGDKVIRIEVAEGTLGEDPLRGPHFVLAADLETVFADRTLRVTVNARAANRHGAEAIRINYAIGNAEESGWREFPMTRQFQDVSFTWDLPPRNIGGEPGYDYLGIRPVVPEKQRAIFVRSVVLEPIGPPKSGAAK